MKIVNYLRANIFRSSSAAFELAMENSKYQSFAEKIISVKNEFLCCELINTNSNLKKEILIKSKIYKYENFLNELSIKKSMTSVINQKTGMNIALNANVPNFTNDSLKPKMKETKLNEQPAYFLAPDRVIITFGKENLI
ncbi:hypothetical protein [Pectobacterium versatile]|uniref:hypothetical protein n=1 Tax=Pectobacterium versatile TaxID=2488639 RepID=UPI001CCC4780|nr:hypothetical protein [Pectobacterium versatile]